MNGVLINNGHVYTDSLMNSVKTEVVLSNSRSMISRASTSLAIASVESADTP